MEQITLEVRGYRFDGLAAGPPDGELVLLLHGFPQFADSWAAVMEALGAGGFRAVAVDQRGYSPGAQPADIGAYGMGELVADVVAFADALGAGRFHLAGHDWGGAVAWAVAAKHPDRLRTLTVLATPHLDAFAEALANDADQKKKSLYMMLFRAPGHLAEKTFLAFDAKVLRGVYEGKVAEAEVERNVARLRAGETLTCALNWYRANEFAGGLGPVRVPTLYVWGDQDVALGAVAAKDTGHYVSGRYQFVRLSGCSHWLLEEEPGQVSRLMLAQFGVWGSAASA